MDKPHSITNEAERKRRQHLGPEEHGTIQYMNRLGFSNRAIARALHCSPSTIGYKLERGTPPYSGRGRRPGYSAKRGAVVYKAHRRRCHRRKTVPRDSAFITWMMEQIHIHRWSFDTCVERARRLALFPCDQIPSTKTLYNLLWRGELPLSLFELPEVLSRRKRGNLRISKRLRGKSIDERPAEVDARNTFGHWESDTVIGCKRKGDPAVFAIVERLTGCYFTLRIDEKTTDGVSRAMEQLREEFGSGFA